ncbi:MAG TPA: class II aldolase/adducin family protein [Rubrobacteraceae bacterium]|nr:class II aldolase/adducin family protein [Rubrobacteraceae bacterium]
MNHPDLRKEIVETCLRMSASGLVAGTEGNVSARTPEGNVLITPSGLDYATMEPGDVVVVSLDGKWLEGSFEPSVETPMHTGIYRSRPETLGVVHTHARFSTTLACLNWEIPPVHYMLANLSDEGRVPVARYATYGTEELARNASEALGSDHRACLLRNHGTICVGATVSQAYSRTELLEQMAEIYYRARAAGQPVVLSAEEMAEVAAKIHDYGQSKPLAVRDR